jgi:putative tryptophan/tyrosine transport system substrate-binding protein
MRRRELLSGLGGAVLSPLLARAQAKLVIGFLHAGSPDGNERRVAAFCKGLAAGGFVDGQNITIEYLWARNRHDKLQEFAADLVHQKVALITTPGSTAAAVAAKNATNAIPIVFSSGSDPIDLGLVGSLNRPGGNATGITSLNAEVAAKRLGVFRELAPNVSRYFTLVKPTSELAAPFVKDLENAAARLGVRVEVLNANTPGEIDAAFRQIPAEAGCGVVFGPEGFFFVRRAEIADLALARRLPTIFDVRDYAEAGGLASYGSDYYNVMELTGGYAARVLKGERPADLPVQQATKFEMVMNRKTARALGIDISPALLATADDVIE